MRNGTTYIVRPRIEPLKIAESFSRASAGAIQLFVGPASSLVLRADERQVLGPRDVALGAAVIEAARELLGVEGLERTLLDRSLLEAHALVVGAVAPDNVLGLAELSDLIHPTPDRFPRGHRSKLLCWNPRRAWGGPGGEGANV